eukprot:1152295-Pelagomonas_calceolata.AAC.2
MHAPSAAACCSTDAQNNSPEPGSASSPWPHTLMRTRLFHLGDSRWYTTSKRAGRSGKSTAVTSTRHLNWVLTWSRRKYMSGMRCSGVVYSVGSWNPGSVWADIDGPCVAIVMNLGTVLIR